MADELGTGRWIVRAKVAAVAVQRAARLVVMIGLAVGVYLALCIFDQAARADDSLTGPLVTADPAAAVSEPVAGTVKQRAAPHQRKTAVPRVAKVQTPVYAGRPTTSGAKKQKATAPKAAQPRALPNSAPLKAARQKVARQRVVPLTKRLRQAAPLKAAPLKTVTQKPKRSLTEVRKASSQRANAVISAAQPEIVKRTKPVAKVASAAQLKGIDLTGAPVSVTARALSTLPGRPMHAAALRLRSTVTESNAALDPLPVALDQRILPAVSSASRPAHRAASLSPTATKPPATAKARTATKARTAPKARTAVEVPATTQLQAPGGPPTVMSLPAVMSLPPVMKLPAVMRLPAVSILPTAIGRPAASGSAVARFRPDATGRSGVRPGATSPKPAPAAPRPAQPGDSSTGAGHVRDSGGGSAPPMGVVTSSWSPHVTTATAPPPADAATSGRTVRYCGPPS